MPTLNRKTGTFIFAQNKEIIYTNLFNTVGNFSEQVYRRDKNPTEFAAGMEILKITKKMKKTAEEKNTSIAPILKMMGVPEEDMPNRLYTAII